MTNAEKFEEVFSFIPTSNQRHEVCPEGYDCDVMPCKECPYSDYWWEREYEQPDRLPFE